VKSKDLLKANIPISRREFTRKTVLAVAAIGTGGLVGYGIFNSKKLRSFNNMHRMGHCAPSVMQTLLELNGYDNGEMVLITGAMAGGIAGPDTECGCLTAPLMFASFHRNGFKTIADKLELLYKSQQYVTGFNASNNSLICSKIRQGGMSSCTKAICSFHKSYLKAMSSPGCLSGEATDSYTGLLEAFEDHNFHCAHNVLHNLGNKFSITKELLHSSWIFTGGIAMLNRTCGALAAGVMALSARTAKIEDSYSRVSKMNRLLRSNSNDAMNEEINNFNRSILLSEELGSWFRNEFGSTTCHDIWGYDFSKTNDSKEFIAGHCMDHCAKMAYKVAQQVNALLI
jgi:hypothetical protein